MLLPDLYHELAIQKYHLPAICYEDLVHDNFAQLVT